VLINTQLGTCICHALPSGKLCLDYLLQIRLFKTMAIGVSLAPSCTCFAFFSLSSYLVLLYISSWCMMRVDKHAAWYVHMSCATKWEALLGLPFANSSFQNDGNWRIASPLMHLFCIFLSLELSCSSVYLFLVHDAC